jgi:hypothetical protein
LEVIAGVDHGIVVAVHRCFSRQLILASSVADAVMLMTAVASRFLFAAAVTLASAVAAAMGSFDFVDDLVQTRTMSTSRIAGGLATRLTACLTGVTADRTDRQQQSQAESQDGLHGVPQGEGVSDSE